MNLLEKQFEALRVFVNREEATSIRFFMVWLLSPEGQVALMDRIHDKDIKIHLNPKFRHCGYFSVALYQSGVGFHRDIELVQEALGWTRQEALINAVLAMLGVEK